MSESLLRQPAVRSKTGLSRSTLYEEVKAGRFPKPIRINGSPQMVAWRSSEVDAWIDAQIRAARPEKIRSSTSADR